MNLSAKIDTLTAKQKEAEKELAAGQAQWETTFRETLKSNPVAWTHLEPKEAKSEGGATLTRQADGSWLAGGKNPLRDTYTITAPIAAGSFSGLLVEVFPDKSLPTESLGRNTNGNFVLTGVEAEIAAPGLSTKPIDAVDFTKAASRPITNREATKSNLSSKTSRRKARARRTKKGWAIDGNDPSKLASDGARLCSTSPSRSARILQFRKTRR